VNHPSTFKSSNSLSGASLYRTRTTGVPVSSLVLAGSPPQMAFPSLRRHMQMLKPGRSTKDVDYFAASWTGVRRHEARAPGYPWARWTIPMTRSGLMVGFLFFLGRHLHFPVSRSASMCDGQRDSPFPRFRLMYECRRTKNTPITEFQQSGRSRCVQGDGGAGECNLVRENRRYETRSGTKALTREAPALFADRPYTFPSFEKSPLGRHHGPQFWMGKCTKSK